MLMIKEVSYGIVVSEKEELTKPEPVLYETGSSSPYMPLLV